MAHARDPVVPPSAASPEVPADLEQVVLRCLAKRADGALSGREGAGQGPGRLCGGRRLGRRQGPGMVGRGQPDGDGHRTDLREPG